MKRTAIRRKTRLRRASRKRATVKELDAMAGRVVVARDGPGCWMAGVSGGCGGPMGTMHLLPKGAHPALRWELMNLKRGCWRHHLHVWHKDPLLAAQIAAERLGEDYLDRLRYLSQTRTGKIDTEAVRMYLEARLARPASQCCDYEPVVAGEGLTHWYACGKYGKPIPDPKEKK